jgi:mannose/fructose/N-acetylgalactosamine-specific phosphotransferase system component IIB
MPFTPSLQDALNEDKANVPQISTEGVGGKILDIINNVGSGAANELAKIGGNLSKFTPNVNVEDIIAHHLNEAKQPGFFANLQQATTQLPGVNKSSIPFRVGGFATDLALPIPEVGLGSKVAALGGGKALQSLGRVGEAAIQGAGAGAVTANPNQMGSGALTGAAVGSLLHGAFATPKTIANAVLRSTAKKAENNIGFLRTPFQVGKINQQLGNQPVNIGEVINSPWNKTIYNATSAIPLNTSRNNPAALVGQTHAFANNLLSKIGNGISPEDSAEKIQQALSDNEDVVQKRSKALYKAVDDAAKQNETNVQYNNYSKAIGNIKNELSNTDSPDPDESKVLAALPDLSTKVASFTRAKNTYSNLLTASRQLAEGGNRNAERLLIQAQKALEQDMEAGAKAGGQDTYEKYRAAQDDFKNNVVPYRAPIIQKIIQDKSNLKNVNTPLVDTSNAKVLEDFTPDQKNMVLYNHLLNHSSLDEDGNPVITPAAMGSAYKKLGANLRKRLVSLDNQGDFNKLNMLNQASKEAQTRLTPPDTGVQAAQQISKGDWKAALGALAWKSAAAFPPALIAANKGLKILYSPGLREAYAAGGYSPVTNVLNTKTGKLALQSALNARNFIYSKNQ